MNSGHLVDPISQSLIEASGALIQWTLQSPATCGIAMKKKNNKKSPKHTNQPQLFLEVKNGVRSNGGQSSPRAEEGLQQ